ncbi:GNAT family N-acetyltransferase [Sutcliffiella sp. NPDC057660]|uniref:GNAT family N-acetyltransferase n=1 Tax=Sutcliffiella sp. NPDC057660 TaxID=3346199 RepID=UPI0036872F86
MALEWIEITNSGTKYLEEVMELYEQSFPIEVRESQDIFHRSIRYSESSFPNNFRFLVGVEDGKVLSFATSHFLASVNAGFVVYIVTNPSIRSIGLGSKTLTKLEELLNADAIKAGYENIDKILLETETKEMVHTEEERAECSKRDKFFEKNGYIHLNSIDYRQPHLHKGESSIPLKLFVKKYNGIEISKDMFQQAIVALYQEKYFKVNEIERNVLHKCLAEMGIEAKVVTF